MTATTDPFPRPQPGSTPTAALPAVPLARLPVAGAAVACATLALAMLLGPHGSRTPVVALGAVAVVILLAALGQRGMAMARTGASVQLGAAVLGIGFVAALWFATVSVGGGRLGLATWGTVLGLALVVTGATRLRRRSSSGGTPWQRIAGGAGREREARGAAIDLMLLFGGGIVLVVGLVAGWRFARDYLLFPGGGGAREYAFVLLAGGALLFVVLVGVGLVLVVGRAFAGGGEPRRWREASPADAPRTPRDEPTIAAHLHDSVLQTLALIGRSADDSDRVRQLARQQERSLRSWLAGRDEAVADTLAGAVRVAAQEVEDEQAGARIEVVAVGDAPLDRATDAMVRAAREAMRNAARHAGSPVRVFVEVDGPVREVFIRDAGGGFALDRVPDERRGVRDAIIARMEHVGGTAMIDSGSGGTEIALRYAMRDGDARA